MLQSLILSSPKTILNKTALLELQSMLSESTPRVRECVALLWLIQMTPRAKLDKKLQVWFTWMLPILQSKKTERPIQDYIVRCLENTINDIIDAKELVEISPSDFFGYFDLVFTINSNLYPQVQVLLLEMLETVKCMAFADEPVRKLRSYFPSLLIRLQPSKSLQRDTILGYMVECLQLDPHCWVLWQQLFSKNLNSSLTLLEHLHGQWSAVHKTFNRGALKQTLEFIVMTLTPSQGKRVKETQRRATEIATDMLHALGSPLKTSAAPNRLQQLQKQLHSMSTITLLSLCLSPSLYLFLSLSLSLSLPPWFSSTSLICQSIGLTRFSRSARELWSEHWPDSLSSDLKSQFRHVKCKTHMCNCGRCSTQYTTQYQCLLLGISHKIWRQDCSLSRVPFIVL
eukprot:sb/3465384/